MLCAALREHATTHAGLTGAEVHLDTAIAQLEAGLAAQRHGIEEFLAPSPPPWKSWVAACPKGGGTSAAAGVHIFVLWGVAAPHWDELAQAIRAASERIVAVLRLRGATDAAASCGRLRRLYGHQPIDRAIIEAKCVRVAVGRDALVVVADLIDRRAIARDEAPAQEAADRRAAALKYELRGRAAALGLPNDFIHGTLNRCEALRDIIFFTRRQPAELIALAARRADDDDDDDASNNNGRVVVTDQSCVAGERPCGWGSTREMLLHLGTTVQFALHSEPRRQQFLGNATCALEPAAAAAATDLVLLVDEADVDATLLALGVYGAGAYPSAAEPGAGALADPTGARFAALIDGATRWVEVRTPADPRGRALAREHGMTLSDLCTDDATCVGQRLDALGGATDSGWDAIGDSDDGDDGDNDDDVEQHLLIDCRTRGGGTPLAARNLAAFIVASAPSLSVHDELVVSDSPAAAQAVACLGHEAEDVVLYFLNDTAPRYAQRDTHEGPRPVNTNVFTLAARLRGAGFDVSATRGIQQTKDLLRTLGLYAAHYRERRFASFGDLFARLNARAPAFEYVVMRNFEALEAVTSPDEAGRAAGGGDGGGGGSGGSDAVSDAFVDEHLDVDVLCTDYFTAKRLLDGDSVRPDEAPGGGAPLDEGGHRILNWVWVGARRVWFDLRFVGDGYYDERLERRMLASRRRVGTFFAPGRATWFHGLLYHAVVHKARVSETYARHFADHGIGDLGLPSLRARLDQWMVANGFQYTRPVDRSVGYYCEQ